MSYSGADTNVLLTRSPLTRRFVRLACVRHTASVNPEPGSNSPNEELDCSVCFLSRSYSTVQRKFKGLDLFSAIILLSKDPGQKKSASSISGLYFFASFGFAKSLLILSIFLGRVNKFISNYMSIVVNYFLLLFSHLALRALL